MSPATARFERLSRSPEQTVEFGRRIGAALRPGDFLALHGDLGAGKTTLTRGIAAGLG
ncbi:MAG: tRNA (adenosine(37)-N6)-threonylcarbamoyltransferase complex ATPase subunit type 1 TsaE, partial [Planctomycetes bacterium]|nr:tRNA (adenosine(37)-N6)-threonylcarbamoyltransferase complex ATPase subunit type 1 TsaE [Planctomycetota bacterium]